VSGRGQILTMIMRLVRCTSKTEEVRVPYLRMSGRWLAVTVEQGRVILTGTRRGTTRAMRSSRRFQPR
jgi:hypothetical protein